MLILDADEVIVPRVFELMADPNLMAPNFAPVLRAEVVRYGNLALRMSRIELADGEPFAREVRVKLVVAADGVVEVAEDARQHEARLGLKQP
jgi:hypothetical protein